MILPKAQLKKIEKGKTNSVFKSISGSGFTGYAKIAFKKDELSVAEILLDSGKIIAAEITKLKSKKTVYGDKAISELFTLDYIIAELYELSSEEVKKIFEINKRAEVKTALPETKTTEKTFEKIKITVSDEEIEELIFEAIGDTEFYMELEKERLMKSK